MASPIYPLKLRSIIRKLVAIAQEDQSLRLTESLEREIAELVIEASDSGYSQALDDADAAERDTPEDDDEYEVEFLDEPENDITW